MTDETTDHVAGSADSMSRRTILKGIGAAGLVTSGSGSALAQTSTTFDYVVVGSWPRPAGRSPATLPGRDTACA